MCTRFCTSRNDCRFKEDCAFTHIRNNNDEEKNNLKEKVEILEKTVIELKNKVQRKEQLETVLHALTRKVLSLEKEMIESKIKYRTVKDVSNKNCPTKESSFNHNDIKHSSSTSKAVKDKVKKGDGKEELLNCKKCNYKCKKKTSSLEKQMIAKH